MKRILAICWAAIALCAVNSFADPVLNLPLPGGYFDAHYFAGSGAKSAYFIVDFGGNGGGVHGFGYRWNGTQTADNALIALDLAGALELATNNFGTAAEPNRFISRLTYPPESDQPAFGVDGRFWNYWLGAYAASNVTWTVSNEGISGREFEDFGNMNGIPNEIIQTLSDGGIYGFYASATAVQPRLPIAVPEPAAWMLAAIGMVMFFYISSSQALRAILPRRRSVSL